MKEAQIIKAYEAAKERYAQIGVDTDEALKKLQNISLSLHCWQTDDVTGFENPDGQLSGGIQATGNYPGKARNIDEVRQDIEKVKTLIPGSCMLSMATSKVKRLIVTRSSLVISKAGSIGQRPTT